MGWNFPATPAVVQNVANALAYPGVVVGVLPGSTERTANGTAMQAFLDWCGANAYIAYFPKGTYEYIATSTQSGRNTGLHANKNVRGITGAGMGNGTRFVQFATNHPALTIGDVGAVDADATLGGVYYGFEVCQGVTQAAQTSADGLLLGRIWASDFDMINVDAARGFQAYVGLRIGLSVAQFFFSNHIGTMKVNTGQLNMVLMDANGTGNNIQNLYVGGGSVGNRTTLTSQAVRLNQSGRDFGTIQQFNIEWVNCSGAGMFYSEAVQIIINHCHFEGCQMAGTNESFLSTTGRVTFGSVTFLNCWIAGSIGTPKLFHTYGGGFFDVGGLNLRWDGGSEQVCSTAIYLANPDTSVGFKPVVEIRNAQFSGHTAAINLDPTLLGAAPGSAGAISGFSLYSYDKTRSTTEGAVIEARNADITIYAAHKFAVVRSTQALTAARKVILSSNMAASGIGNVATRLAGDGVTVFRESSATGAFDLTVRNSADTVTSITLSSASTEGKAILDTAGTWDAS
jgi:hypothetical protein